MGVGVRGVPLAPATDVFTAEISYTFTGAGGEASNPGMPFVLMLELHAFK